MRIQFRESKQINKECETVRSINKCQNILPDLGQHEPRKEENIFKVYGGGKTGLWLWEKTQWTGRKQGISGTDPTGGQYLAVDNETV